MDEIPAVPPPPQGAHRKSALQSAIAYLRRGLRRDGTYPDVDEWEVAGHQWRLLHDWAGLRGLNLPLSVIPTQTGGREHDVSHDAPGARWIKFTKPDMAGYAVEMIGDRLIMNPAKPLQYLERWKIYNRLFCEDVELVGLRSEGHSHRIVVSQEDWGGDTPTWAEIEQAMVEAYEMQRIYVGENLGGYEARAYRKNRFVIFDVRPANCTWTTDNFLVPFDCIPQVFTRKEIAALRKLSDKSPR